MSSATRAFLHAKLLGLGARLRRLERIDRAFVGLRPQDMPYAPSPAHFAAANGRLDAAERGVQGRYQRLLQRWRLVDTPQGAPVDRLIVDMALVEREMDRVRRLFGMFYEVFAQRGTSFGPALAAHDTVALDCYTAVRENVPELLGSPLLKPVCYMEHGYSPATMRRGVSLARLLGEANPFPLIRIPWDRDQPWQAVFLHEVAHNLQADLGIWQENERAVMRRAMEFSGTPLLTTIWRRWHKEVFADLAAILLGGPAAAWGMAEFLAHPAPRTLTYRPGSAHPTAYLRVFILCEALRRLGFTRDAGRLARVWRTLYDAHAPGRIPGALIGTAGRLVPQVVDEILFQPRRNLAQHAVADVIRFTREDEARIREGARHLADGRPQRVELPPRHLVSAAHYALGTNRVSPAALAQGVTQLLVDRGAGASRQPRLRLVA
jgi:hypothetical protein